MDQDKREGQGFRQIGSLIPKIEMSQEQRGIQSSKLIDSRSASETIGSANREIAGANSIGKRHGEITSGVGSHGYKLADLHPVVTDKMLRELLPPRAASLISTAEVLNKDYEIVGYKRLDLSPSEALSILESTDQFFIPAPYEMILKGLAKARAMTKRRAEQADDEEITLAAYAGLFVPWPADVTAIVLSKMHRLEGGWWPSADRVERELESFGRARLALRQALLAVTRL